MQYILTGFTHDMGFRVFAFEGVGEDRVRTEYRVKADLALIRRYGIRVQELPLLCRAVLERHSDVLRALSAALLKDETVSGALLRELLPLDGVEEAQALQPVLKAAVIARTEGLPA